MDNPIFNDKVFRWTDPDQILNMGGPYVGTLWYNEKFIASNVLTDNFIYERENEIVYFAMYHPSKWKDEHYFSLNYIVLITDQIYCYDMRFKAIYLDEIRKQSILVYYSAFHNQIIDFRKEMILDKTKWIKTSDS